MRLNPALAVAVFALSACDNQDSNPMPWGCTEVGCRDAYRIFLIYEDARFPSGQYLIRVTPAVGEIQECTFTVSIGPPECSSGSCISEKTCNEIFLFEYPDADRILMLLPVIDSPVLVEVSVDGILATAVELVPVYEAVRPNGPDCPPECMIATNEVTVPAQAPNKHLQRPVAE